MRGIRRFQARCDDLDLLPICIYQWKGWVAKRKEFKKWLQYCENRALSFARCETTIAFEKWKNLHAKHKQVLMAQQRDLLEKKLI